ncbi:MAG: NYN domain-containing protein [Planctomycetota bacterium]|nr:MAG: NYN domain-containing protein [Planctomycetota bacterium]
MPDTNLIPSGVGSGSTPNPSDDYDLEDLEQESPRGPEDLAASPVVLDPNEEPGALTREDLEDRYLDLKDEVWRLRRLMNLNPATGELPNNGGYASPGGFLKRQRVAVFVDVQNMYHSAKKTYGRNLSYAKMLRHCVRNRRLIRSIAYVIEREGIDQVSFLDHLRYCGFEVRRREVIERADGSRKAEWELGIAMDMLRIAEKVDVIIVVSGNGVFADVAPILQARGVKFEACAFRESLSDVLARAVDQYHILTEDHLYK